MNDDDDDGVTVCAYDRINVAWTAEATDGSETRQIALVDAADAAAFLRGDDLMLTRPEDEIRRSPGDPVVVIWDGMAQFSAGTTPARATDDWDVLVLGLAKVLACDPVDDGWHVRLKNQLPRDFVRRDVVLGPLLGGAASGGVGVGEPPRG
mmetsp:Transcript_6629/g.27835  ORF Transcript_6629/g.27835 Transcript_6629/m.27835 type:complete len:151 (-) Transcript_6629:32-484(-)